jgi:hypothetical protein
MQNLGVNGESSFFKREDLWQLEIWNALRYPDEYVSPTSYGRRTPEL